MIQTGGAGAEAWRVAEAIDEAHHLSFTGSRV